MECSGFVSEVRTALLPFASAARAAPMQAYMKGRFSFLGIATPQRRAATMPLIRAFRSPAATDLLSMADALWQQTEREYQYVAADLLARHHRQLSTAELPALLALVRERAWWDSVDSMTGVIGDVLRRAREQDSTVQAHMDVAVRDADFWVRRVAMLHQLGWRDAIDLQRLFAYAQRLAPEREFFIRKAIGWALRDCARHHPAAVRAFVEQLGDQLAPLSRREALKHLV